MLLDAGAMVKESDALHVAARKGSGGILRRLLTGVANINEIGFEYSIDERLAQEAGSGLYFYGG